MVSFTHVIKSPLFFDVLSRQTHIHLTGRFYFFQISFSIGMLDVLDINSIFMFHNNLPPILTILGTALGFLE